MEFKRKKETLLLLQSWPFCLLRLSSSSSLGIGVKCRNRSVKVVRKEGKKRKKMQRWISKEREGEQSLPWQGMSEEKRERERENRYLVSKPNTPICPIDVRRRVIGSQSGATSIGYTWMSIANNRSPRRYWRCSNSSVHGDKWSGWTLNRRCAKTFNSDCRFSINQYLNRVLFGHLLVLSAFV